MTPSWVTCMSLWVGLNMVMIGLFTLNKHLENKVGDVVISIVLASHVYSPVFVFFHQKASDAGGRNESA